MNIMISTNKKYLPYTRIMLYSLFTSHPLVPIDIWLTYDELEDEDIDVLGGFIDSFESKKFHPVYVGDELRNRIHAKNGISIETFYRILAIELLPKEMDRILHLDVDLIVRGDITGLYGTDLTGKAFSACEDIFGILNGFHKANKFRMNIPDNYTYFNAGVLLMNLDFLREHNASEVMLERVYIDNDRYEYNDQDVMNEMFFDKVRIEGWDIYNCPPGWYFLSKSALDEGKVEFADYNTITTIRSHMHGQEEIDSQYINVTNKIYDNAHIIHYMGDTKPWSTTRNDAEIFKLFDSAFNDTEAAMKRMRW